MKFRKRPLIVEAIQFNGDDSLSRMENHWKEAFNSVADYGYSEGLENFFIETMEGNMCALLGDWIIKGIHGEFYTCKPDIFEKTYERVEE